MRIGNSGRFGNDVTNFFSWSAEFERFVLELKSVRSAEFERFVLELKSVRWTPPRGQGLKVQCLFLAKYYIQSAH